MNGRNKSGLDDISAAPGPDTNYPGRVPKAETVPGFPYSELGPDAPDDKRIEAETADFEAALSPERALASGQVEPAPAEYRLPCCVNARSPRKAVPGHTRSVKRPSLNGLESSPAAACAHSGPAGMLPASERSAVW